MTYNLDFYTTHSQFYICDKNSPRNTGSYDFWNTEAFNDRLAIEDGILGVGTECYGPVKLELEVLTAPNNDEIFLLTITS